MSREALIAIKRAADAEIAEYVEAAAFWREHGPPFDTGPRGERSISFGLAEEYEADALLLQVQVAEIEALLAAL